MEMFAALRLSCVVFYMIVKDTVTVTREYCSDEIFSATCDDNNVILIQNATYGLMKHTRCTQEEFYTRYIGCKNDALNIMDRECSGRTSCEVEVFDAKVFGTLNACPKGLAKYLEIDYTCIRVDAIDTGCNLSAQGTLSSVAESGNCGSPNNPFTKKALPGQNIQIWVNDLAYRESSAGSSSCNPIGFITEDVVRTNKTLCGGSGLRNQLLYQSVGHEISIVIARMSFAQIAGTILLHHEVIGCADPPLNSNTWYVRDGNTIRYGCNEDDLGEESKCIEGIWDSPITNCISTNSKDASHVKDLDKTVENIDEGIMIGIIIGVAVLLSIIVLVCGVVFAVKRQRSHFTSDDTYIQGEKLSDSEFKMYNTMQYPFETTTMPNKFGVSQPGPSVVFLPPGPIDHSNCDCDCMEQTK